MIRTVKINFWINKRQVSGKQKLLFQTAKSMREKGVSLVVGN